MQKCTFHSKNIIYMREREIDVVVYEGVLALKIWDETTISNNNNKQFILKEREPKMT